MIRTLATDLLAVPPIWSVLRRRALGPGDVTILCYHTLGPDTGGVNGWTVLRARDFRAQLAWLVDAYEIIDLDDALAGAETTKPALVITFDDGDQGLHAYLLPILRETPVPVTVYVATGQFETRRPFWFDRVVNALQGRARVTLDGIGAWDLPGTGDKAHWDALRPIMAALKAAPTDERDHLADQVAAQGQTAPAPALGPMRRAELAELAAHPSVTIGAHSHGHELLDQITPDAARDSVARSRNLLQDWTGQEVAHFAFPNGNATPALSAMIRDLGFASATVLEERVVPEGADPFALPRISVGRYDSLARLKLRMVGV
jgi:peptidoglycan/xylan/chitin deacetylase (PgdA/CDA1 family)